MSATGVVSEAKGDRRRLEIQVAGVHYTSVRLRSAVQVGDALVAKREPDNAHDANAVSLWWSRTGSDAEKVGFVPARVAARLAPHLDRGCNLKVTVIGIPLNSSDPYLLAMLDLDVAGPTHVQAAPVRQPLPVTSGRALRMTLRPPPPLPRLPAVPTLQSQRAPVQLTR